MNLKRRVKDLVRFGASAAIEGVQGLGVDVLPHTFYSEIPTFRDLRRTSKWKLPRSMVNVRGAELDAQMAFMREVCSDGLVARQRVGDIYSAACANNEAGYGPIEADFLHSFVGSKRPGRVIQVGCGVSTAVILQAAKEADYKPDVVCIDPFPTQYLSERGAAGDIRLMAKPMQDVPIEELADLGPGDLLFVDSTHTVKAGSEVNIVILEILPRLQPGVWVHFHDIYFPYDYGRSILAGAIYFYNESVLLHAYLTGNRSIRIAASMSMLHYGRASQMQQCLPNYVPAENDEGLKPSRLAAGHFPSSTYLETLQV